jgi:hypothetical protein
MLKLWYRLEQIPIILFYVFKFGFIPPLENGIVMGEFQDIYESKSRKKDITECFGDFSDYKELHLEGEKLNDEWTRKICIVWHYYCFRIE